MTSKERVDILYDFVETKLEDSGDIIECWSHLEYIEEDLSRLEKLEKVIEILKKQGFDIYKYTNVINGNEDFEARIISNSNILTKEEYELLKEVFNYVLH